MFCEWERLPYLKVLRHDVKLLEQKLQNVLLSSVFGLLARRIYVNSFDGSLRQQIVCLLGDKIEEAVRYIENQVPY